MAINYLEQELASIRRQIKVYKANIKKTNDQQIIYDLSRKISELEVQQDQLLKELERWLFLIACYIDDREQKRGLRAFDYFKDKFPTKAAELLYGDFVFKDSDTGINVAFEYKTLEDYIHSIKDNRVFNQALNQSNNFDYHYIIVVGTDKEKQEVIRENQRYTGQYITKRQFYGSYASLVNISSLIQVPNESTAFLVMELVAEHCCNDKPVVKRFNKSRGSAAYRLLNNNVSRVGGKTAERICKELNLVTIEDVLGLTKEDLTSVAGVGDATAVSILRQLKREFE